jgi:MFS family permease
MSINCRKPETTDDMTPAYKEKIKIPRIIWITAFKFSFISFLLIGSFEVLFVIGKDSILQLTGNPALAGLPVSIHSLGGLLLVIPMGIITDKVSRKFGIMLSSLLNVLGLACLSFSIRFNSLPLFFTGLFVLGVGTAGVQISSLVGTDIFPPDRKTEGMAVIVMGGNLGALFGPLLGGAVFQLSVAAGLEPIGTTWLGAALVSVVAFFVALTININTKQVSACPELYYEMLGYGDGEPENTMAVERQVLTGGREKAGGDGGAKNNIKYALATLKNHILQYPILASFLTIVMAQGIRLSLLPHLSPIMVSRGMTTIMASASVSAMSIGGLIICYPGGRIIDLLGRKRIMMLSGLGLVVCVLAVTNLKTYGLIMLMLILMGLFRSLCNLASGAMITDVVPAELKGTLFAMRSIVIQVTIIIVPLLSGFLINKQGFGSIGYLGICLSLPALAALFMLKEISIGKYSYWGKKE